jgi:hypothetical protein
LGHMPLLCVDHVPTFGEMIFPILC